MSEPCRSVLGGMPVRGIVAKHTGAVGCELCGLKFRFAAVHADGLFKPASTKTPGTPAIR